MDEVPDVLTRTRMVQICSQRKASSLAGKNLVIRPVGDDSNFFVANSGSWRAEQRVERIGAYAGERKNPDAQPTKAAKQSLDRLLPAIDPFGKTTDH